MACLPPVQLDNAPMFPLQKIEDQSLFELLEKENLIKPLIEKNDYLNLLECVSFMTQLTIEAVQAFRTHKLNKFDALVGENACHLRAAKMKDLADQYLNSPKFQAEIAEVERNAQEILNQLILKTQMVMEAQDPSPIDFKKKKKRVPAISPLKFCEDHGLLQSISEDVSFLVKSFILTETKEVRISPERPHQPEERTNELNLNRFIVRLDGNHPDNASQSIFSKKKLSNLVRKIQKNFSALSINYLQEQAIFLHDKEFVQILSKGIKKDPFGRVCAPCLYSMDILFQSIIEKKQHILVDIIRWTHNGQKQVDRIKKLYVGDPANKRLKQIAIDEDQPLSVFVIVGNSLREGQDQPSKQDYLAEFDSYPIEMILNANTAQHEQYPKGVQDEELLEGFHDQRKKALAAQAEVIGCSIKNQSLFAINHIYCDQFETALNNEEIL